MADAAKVELGTLATSLPAATGSGTYDTRTATTDESNPCSVESDFSDLLGRARSEVRNGQSPGAVGKSMWSSSLTSFVDNGSRKSPFDISVLRQSTRCILVAAALLAVAFGSLVAWRVVATNNVVQAELYAQQDIEIDKFRTLVVGRLSEKLREVYRLALAPSGHSCAFFREWGALDPDVLQVRAIDTSGQETIRAELGKHSMNGTITPNWDSCGKLQDKSRRGYVDTSLQLPVSSVYISEVDLNMEYGKVEIPYNPVYRISAPTFASLNNVSSRTGFLIANINASHIWQHVSESLVRGQLAAGLGWDILNTNLHYLASSRPDKSILYGHVLPERSHVTYSGPLRQQIQERLFATADNPARHAPSVRNGINVSVVLLYYSMLSENLLNLKLLGEGGLVLVLSYDENEVWRETVARLTPFFILVPFLYIAALAIFGSICAWVQMIKRREEKNKASHRFLAGMSHDLRSPLHVMSSCLQLLHTEELEQKYEFRALEAAVESMLALLSNTVYIYRSSKDDHVPPQKTCLRRAVISLMEVTSFLANEKDLNIELHIAEDLPEVLLLNWVGLKQILANLLSNGIKFTSRGGIAMTIEADAVPETSSVALRISIADTGPGLPGDGRYSSTISSKDSGGLGLAICSRIVESMGATLQGVSTPGQGCVFTLDNLICPVLEVAKPQSVWGRMAAIRKDGYDIVAVVGAADRPSVLPAIVKFVSQLRVTSPVQLRIVSGPELAGNAAVITPNSVVFIGSHVFHDEKLLTLMSRRLRATGSSAIVLSYVCGSLSHANAMAYVCEEFPCSTYVYPPWMPERIAVQVEAQARKVDASNRSSLKKVEPAAAAAAAPGTEIGSMKEAQDLRVLVVDDMAVNRKIISRILLRKFKVTATEASGGAECQDLCREGQGFDLVLMDLHMPGMDGIESTQKLREVEQEMELEPALIAGLSASVLERDHANCLECGMDAYYSKPITPEQLGKVLQQALRRKKLGEAVRQKFVTGRGSREIILPFDPANEI